MFHEVRSIFAENELELWAKAGINFCAGKSCPCRAEKSVYGYIVNWFHGTCNSPWWKLPGLAHTSYHELLLFHKQEHARNACNKLHPCGHMCGGIKGETVCLPCLHGCSSNPTLKQDADDMCMICFTEALSCAPAVQVKLWNCTKEVRITCGPCFNYSC